MYHPTLRIFHEVVQRGSIRRAAEAMGVAPSSVSRQVSVLEHQMGTTLLDRSTAGVKLTHAGVMVAEYARSVVLEFDVLKGDLDDLKGGRRRLIRLALVESIVSAGPLEAIALFRTQYSDVTFRINMMPATRVVEALKRNTCDIGLTLSPEISREIQSVANVPEPIKVVISAEDPWHERADVQLADIVQRAVAAPDEDFGVRRIFDQAVAKAKLSFAPVLVSDSFEALRDFVRCGGGICILPSRAIQRDAESGRLIGIAIDDSSLKETAIHVAIPKANRTPRIIGLFINTLVDILLR